MKIVIDIPKAKYLSLKKCLENDIPLGMTDIAILNGTPLPEGYGDLIDRNKLMVDYTSYDWDDYVSMEQIMNANVVIEADKEG